MKKVRDNNYRVRSGVLGDIIHSNPVYVGKPQMNYPENFPDIRVMTVSKVLLVMASSMSGANDGTPHGFDEVTGEERFAYVPNAVSFQTAQGSVCTTRPTLPIPIATMSI